MARLWIVPISQLYNLMERKNIVLFCSLEMVYFGEVYEVLVVICAQWDHNMLSNNTRVLTGKGMRMWRNIKLSE